jgi:hypothetical protein
MSGLAFVLLLHNITLESGDNMSGTAITFINGYPVDSDYTWLSARE